MFLFFYLVGLSLIENSFISSDLLFYFNIVFSIKKLKPNSASEKIKLKREVFFISLPAIDVFELSCFETQKTADKVFSKLSR